MAKIRLKNKLTKEEWEAQPEVVRDAYDVQADGTYVLDAEEAASLKVALDKERKEKGDLKTELGQIRDTKDKELKEAREALAALADRKDIDPTKYAELVKKEEAAAIAQLEAEKKYDEAKQAAVDAATKPLAEQIAALRKSDAEKDARLQSEESFTEKLLVHNRIAEYVGKRGVPQLQDGFRALLGTKTKAKVLRKGDERQAVVEIDGKDVPIEEFLATVEKADWAQGFLTDSTSGNGGGGTGEAEKGKPASEKSGAAGEKKVVAAADFSASLDEIAGGKAVLASE